MKSIGYKTSGFYLAFGKRLFDIALSLTVLIVLIPLFLVLWLVVMLTSEGPGIFKQQRVGRFGRAFVLYKFRTMKDDSANSGPGITSGDDERITPLGRHLRKYKLDELPQLYNVLKGDMSLVGPRPESKKYVDLFRSDYESILEYYPGLTDYAAITFRNEEELLKGYEDAEDAYIKHILPEKILLYKQYISDVSFSTDLKILFRTFLKVALD